MGRGCGTHFFYRHGKLMHGSEIVAAKSISRVDQVVHSLHYSYSGPSTVRNKRDCRVNNVAFCGPFSVCSISRQTIARVLRPKSKRQLLSIHPDRLLGECFDDNNRILCLVIPERHI